MFYKTPIVITIPYSQINYVCDSAYISPSMDEQTPNDTYIEVRWFDPWSGTFEACLTKYKAYIAPTEDEQTTNNTNSKVRWFGPWAGRASVIP